MKVDRRDMVRTSNISNLNLGLTAATCDPVLSSSSKLHAITFFCSSNAKSNKAVPS